MTQNPNHPSMSQALLDIFTAPASAFELPKQKASSFWLPLSLQVLAVVAVSSWYFNTADLSLYLDHVLTNLTTREVPELTTEQEQQQIGIMRFQGVFATLTILVIYLLLTVYFHLTASVLTERKVRFGNWFAMVCWASMPLLVAQTVIAVSYATSSGFVPYEQLDLGNLNAWISLQIVESQWFTLVNSINLFNLWSYILMMVGYRKLTEGSMLSSVLVVLIPWLLIYGIWSLTILI